MEIEEDTAKERSLHSNDQTAVCTRLCLCSRGVAMVISGAH